ncbi:hypothetical protein A4X13_0g6708 [Tilletia indica]|uniref:Transmembrane protein n=1 Tax=Tilletia indica TaxID=43049 RepID=A0A8T8SNP4_9BASI|nr:hypothetical protein A4X13_0g6708 [Tilletia indica]
MPPATLPPFFGAGPHNFTLGHGLQLPPNTSNTSFLTLGDQHGAKSHSIASTALPSLAVFTAFVLHGCLLPYAFLALRQNSVVHNFWRWMAAVCTLCSTATCAIWLHLCWILAISDCPHHLILGDYREYSSILLFYSIQECGAKALLTHFARHSLQEKQRPGGRTNYELLFCAVVPASVGLEITLRLISMALMFEGSQVTASRIFAAANFLSSIVFLACAASFISALKRTRLDGADAAKSTFIDVTSTRPTSPLKSLVPITPNAQVSALSMQRPASASAAEARTATTATGDALSKVHRSHQIDPRLRPEDAIDGDLTNTSNSRPPQQPKPVKTPRSKPRLRPIETHYPPLTPILMSAALTTGGVGASESFAAMQGNIPSATLPYPQPSTPRTPAPRTAVSVATRGSAMDQGVGAVRDRVKSRRSVDRLGKPPGTPIRRAIVAIQSPFSQISQLHPNNKDEDDIDDERTKVVSMHSVLCWLAALCCLQTCLSAAIFGFCLLRTITWGPTASCYALMATIDVLAMVIALAVHRKSAELVQNVPFDFIKLIRTTTDDRSSTKDRAEGWKPEITSTPPILPQVPSQKQPKFKPGTLRTAPPFQQNFDDWTRSPGANRPKSAVFEDSNVRFGDNGDEEEESRHHRPRSDPQLPTILSNTPSTTGSEAHSRTRAEEEGQNVEERGLGQESEQRKTSERRRSSEWSGLTAVELQTQSESRSQQADVPCVDDR